MLARLADPAGLRCGAGFYLRNGSVNAAAVCCATPFGAN